MRKLATCLLFTPLFLGGCLEPTTPQAVIDSEPKASQGVIWLQDYPAEVTFDASKSTGEIVSWEWDFGDGGMTEGETVDHTFTAPGDYTVILTVTDDSGGQAVTSRTVTVEECIGGHCGRR